jgi:hypothetical protein
MPRMDVGSRAVLRPHREFDWLRPLRLTCQDKLACAATGLRPLSHPLRHLRGQKTEGRRQGREFLCPAVPRWSRQVGVRRDRVGSLVSSSQPTEDARPRWTTGRMLKSGRCTSASSVRESAVPAPPSGQTRPRRELRRPDGLCSAPDLAVALP